MKYSVQIPLNKKKTLHVFETPLLPFSLLNMFKLYKFSLQENWVQFRDFLVQSVPTTTTLLGWLLGTGFYDSDPEGKCSIWTSHPDPFHCNEPMVWIFDSKHRIRVFVTSEVVLDLGTFTPEARDLADGAVKYGKTLPNYFVEPQLEMLYNQSKEMLKSVLKAYMELNDKINGKKKHILNM